MHTPSDLHTSLLTSRGYQVLVGLCRTDSKPQCSLIRLSFQESTIGAAFLTQTVAVSDAVVKFEIWDTAGQERYHALAPMYYRGAAAAVIVYDITSKVSLMLWRGVVTALQETIFCALEWIPGEDEQRLAMHLFPRFAAVGLVWTSLSFHISK